MYLLVFASTLFIFLANSLLSILLTLNTLQVGTGHGPTWLQECGFFFAGIAVYCSIPTTALLFAIHRDHTPMAGIRGLQENYCHPREKCSEQAYYVACFIHVHIFRCRMFRQSRHGHYLAKDRHDKACTCRNVYRFNVHLESLWAVQQRGVV